MGVAPRSSLRVLGLPDRDAVLLMHLNGTTPGLHSTADHVSTVVRLKTKLSRSQMDLILEIVPIVPQLFVDSVPSALRAP
ncbi:MAG: hypothetical protein OXN89_13255 [Bryobacterales bacterium]|nr:hypothetical protein [Bryobacterales bacterium]